MQLQHAILFTFALLLSACNPLYADQNDTQIGDDGGTAGDDGTPPPDPEPVVDHGVAQYCVNRAVEQGLWDLEEIQAHERWYHPLGRSYQNHLDISDKPSPMSVPLACPWAWPMSEMYKADAALRGGSPSCFNSGYHLQLPWVGTSDFIGPGHARFPYSKDLIVGTIGNPPESGRHTYLAPACCGVTPSAAEVASPDWILTTLGLAPGLFTTPHADCVAYVATLGVHSTAAGYAPAYDKPTMLARALNYTTCITPNRYPAGATVNFGMHKLGQPVVYHPTRLADQYPANINYDWVASLGLVGWSDFAAFGATVDAVIKALISSLYLPPDNFEHARYRIGGGCHFPTALRWTSSGHHQVVARFSCPIGYYADFPNFAIDDDFRNNGIIGTCVIDGVDYGDSGAGFVSGGSILSPVQSGNAGETRLHAVRDVDMFGHLLAEAAGVVTPALAALFVGDSVIEVGDTIAWHSSPWEAEPLPIAEALEATLSHDVAELQRHTGWTYAEAARFVDDQGLGAVGHFVDGLPEPFAQRPISSLRPGTFQLRIERTTAADTQVMFLYFVRSI